MKRIEIRFRANAPASTLTADEIEFVGSWCVLHTHADNRKDAAPDQKMPLAYAYPMDLIASVTIVADAAAGPVRGGGSGGSTDGGGGGGST